MNIFIFCLIYYFGIEFASNFQISHKKGDKGLAYFFIFASIGCGIALYQFSKKYL